MIQGFPPRLMKARDAAHYLGVSQSKLREMNIPRKRDGGNVLYDRADLDSYADRLPYDNQEANTCDALFLAEL